MLWPTVVGGGAPGGRGGAASGRHSGSTVSRIAPKINKAFCQPARSISATASGANRNWPNEPAAVPMVKGRLVIEVSGGITLDTIAEIAATGVDYASSGALTHSAPALDIGLDIEI